MRKWFRHDPERWEEFKEKYAKELKSKRDLIDKIKQIEKDKGTITLLYAAKDTQRNNAIILESVVKKCIE